MAPTGSWLYDPDQGQFISLRRSRLGEGQIQRVDLAGFANQISTALKTHIPEFNSVNDCLTFGASCAEALRKSSTSLQPIDLQRATCLFGEITSCDQLATKTKDPVAIRACEGQFCARHSNTDSEYRKRITKTLAQGFEAELAPLLQNQALDRSGWQRDLIERRWRDVLGLAANAPETELEFFRLGCRSSTLVTGLHLHGECHDRGLHPNEEPEASTRAPAEQTN
jgi:hypothetical protein